MKMTLSVCRRRLAILWLGGAGVVFVLLFLQSVLGRYGENVAKAWGWFLPTVMPTLSLIIGVLAIAATRKAAGDKEVDRFFYRLAFGLSAFYLLLVALTLLLQPFLPFAPLELMQQSNLWLGPLQGLVSAALGIFFVKGEQGGGFAFAKD